MKGRILLIDDDVEMCGEIGDILQNEGYEVSMAFDGLSGWRLIGRKDFDLLLLDLKLPGASGFNILGCIRSRNMDLKVLVLTGRPLTRDPLKPYDAAEDVEETTLKLADVVVSKPFDVPALLERISELVDAGGGRGRFRK